MRSGSAKDISTPANWMTLGRLFVAPLVFVLFFFGNDACRLAGLVLFAAGAISDFWDGYVARRTRVSEFGKLWDPIADKALTGVALVALSAIGVLPWWVTIALVARDVVVTALRIARIRTGRGIILPSLPAKLKTTLELVMLLALFGWVAVVRKPIPPAVDVTIVVYGGVLVALSWGTAIHYIALALSRRG